MPRNSDRESRVEEYARVLYDAGVSAGHTGADLVQWRHAVKFSPEVLRVLSTMEDNADTALIEAVSSRLSELVDGGDNAAVVTVTTSVAMDDALRAKVTAKAEELFGAPVYLVERIEPSILGGIILEARGERYDASVATQLVSIRRSLSQTFVGGAA